MLYGPKDEGARVETEAQDISGLYPNTVTVELDANKTRFLENLKRPSILHYAGHSVDAQDPLRSAILLDGEKGGPNSVTAADISRQRMWPNAVVILASCDSSIGNFRDGVGLRGLTSAFLVAGAGTVAGSLWPVEDTSTSGLMLAFHRSFAKRMSAAEAMGQAQRAFIGGDPGTAHPYFWSGFVVNGNLSALR
jgi:CHAT domain-containing protein